MRWIAAWLAGILSVCVQVQTQAQQPTPAPENELYECSLSVAQWSSIWVLAKVKAYSGKEGTSVFTQQGNLEQAAYNS